MNQKYFVTQLANNIDVFKGLLKDVTFDQARWKPTPDKWSMLEVVNHLHDEEIEDFRMRLELVLTDPQQAWPAIDPQNWVTTRGYNERELESSLTRFLLERDKSLAWLEQLGNPQWNNRQERPTGSLSAGDLLASWVAHDFLHIRQLTRLHWQHLGQLVTPYQTSYAGPWAES